MKKLFIISFLALSILTATAQTKSEQSVAKAVETLRKAMVDADSAALVKITDEDLSYGHSGGKIENKTSFITSLLNGSSDFVTIDLSNQTITVKGKTAIVRHILSASTNDNGKPGSVKLSILLVWHKQHQQWKLLARQAVKAQ